MKKLFVLLAMTLAIGACRGSVPVSAPSPEPVTDGNHYPVPVAVPGERISVKNITGATDKEIDVIRQGVAKANAVLETKCFQQWVLAAKYTEIGTLTQQQVLDKILGEPMTIDFEMYLGSWTANRIYKTVGYENDPFDGVVHANRYFVKTANDVADLLLHEDRGHSIGFRHDRVKGTSEPYGMNYAFEGCTYGQQMQKKEGKPYKPPGIRLEIRRRASR